MMGVCRNCANAEIDRVFQEIWCRGNKEVEWDHTCPDYTERERRGRMEECGDADEGRSA